MISIIYRAVRQAIADDPFLSTELSGPFDQPTPDAVLPYAVIGPVSATDEGTKTSTGQRVAVQITLFVAHRGGKPARELAEHVAGVLGQLELVHTEVAMAASRVSLLTIISDPEDGTAQAVLEFQALLFAVGAADA